MPIARTPVEPPDGPAARGFEPLAWALFGLGLVFYLATRLWGIARFPIYFFCDEANPTVLAEEIFSRGLRDQSGWLFPLYFEIAPGRWCPELQIYFHGVGDLLFGRSVAVTRSTQVVVSLLAPVAAAAALKLVFRARTWWAAPLLFSVSSTWFLHSRTGFNPVVMATFYGCFVVSYLLYRNRSPRYVFAAVAFAAATFYSYSNGQMVIVTAALLLAAADARYHWENRRRVLPALLLAAALALPALRFQLSSPTALRTQLRTVGSYWFTSQPLPQKALRFATTYAKGLSPAYWFGERDEIDRHRMKGYGRISRWLFPVFAVGVALAAWRALRGSAPDRVVLLAALATPVGAALLEVGITRVFAFLFPATLLIGIGLEALAARVVRRVPEAAVALALFAGLAAPAAAMTRDALANGPVWFDDYGLYGMQYGARQVFGDLVPGLLREFPDATVGVSPTWANGTEVFLKYFVPRELQPRVRMAWVGDFLAKRQPIPPGLILVTTTDEYARTKASGKFREVEVLRRIPYPDGKPGFLALRIAYGDDADRLFAEDAERRTRLVAEVAVVGGERVTVAHSPFDLGSLPDLFDGDRSTLARGLEANPLVLDFTFPSPRTVRGLSASFGSMDFTLEAALTAEGEETPRVYSRTFRDLPLDPKVEWSFDAPPARVARVRLTIRQLGVGDEAHVHVREIAFR